MLHEILLSLSGQPSPLFDQPARRGDGGHAQEGFPLLSPPERAQLEPIARLSGLHRELRACTSQISSSHPSTICRAVSTAISTRHLGNFQKKVLEVEKAILATDAGYVGGYGIVPLSTIVGEFTPWVRRLEWLWDVVQFISPQLQHSQHETTANVCTGNKLIDYLRKESLTGYLDLEEMAMGLIKVAETAWLRQLSTWILYGQFPSSGGVDFFIQERSTAHSGQQNGHREYIISPDLLPSFVSPATASSILFVGKSLSHIRIRGTLSTSGELSHPTSHGEYIRRLASLTSPISAMSLSATIAEIRTSLSQNILSKLLPPQKITETLSVLHDFLLLGRGEFAMALVTFAEKRLLAKAQSHGRGKATSILDSLTITDGDAATVLAQACSELYALQNEEEPIDDELDLARELLYLSVEGSKKDDQISSEQTTENGTLFDISDVSFNDLLFSTPTSLSLRIQPPLDLCLAPSDIAIYSKIHSYLLGIRRAQIRLSELWKLTSLRRTHPAPWGPPLSNKPGGQQRLKSVRERERLRAVSMRAIWASGSAALFVLSQLGSYLQGQVISGSWSHFKQWLDSGQSPASENSRPGTSSSARYQGILGEADDTSTVWSATKTHRHDPEAIAVAHRIYLANLSQCLFIADIPFTRALRDLLTKVDLYIALITQLQTVQQNLDLEEDEGVVDSLADYAADEKRIWTELRQARASLETAITELIARLRDIDDSRLTEGKRLFDYGDYAGDKSQFGEWTNEYVPWKGAGVDRLLMSLDTVNVNTKNEGNRGYEFGGLVWAE
ncbi:hypothetical protein VTO42DRAFT_6085 [Malbranchea cinnamomea]